MSQDLDPSPELTVYHRYAQAALQPEAALCCAVEYDRKLLEVIPQEVLERDYGCGDPTRFVRTGETVLDLGSGSGKGCFLLSQVVGKAGRVIGIDCNREMLALARRHAPTVAERVGFANVEFRRGLIQDLQLDLDRLDEALSREPVTGAEGWLALRDLEEGLRRERPLVAEDSIDCVVSNCVLNLVRQQDRRLLFSEMFRVLKPCGRAAISDIVAGADVPEGLRRDPELYSGCISGAFREDRFLEAFREAGFVGITLAARRAEPWRSVAGIDFRSVTVLAWKPSFSAEAQSAIYRGPFQTVTDDNGQTYVRGVPVRSGSGIEREPYREHFHFGEGTSPSPGFGECCR